MATDGTYVFTSDLFQDQVRRVRMNGSDASVWSVSGPFEVECDARNGLVYVSSDGGVRVFDSDGTGGSPLDVLFEGPAGTAPGEAESIYHIGIHPVTGEIFVVDQRWFNYQDPEEREWVSRIQRFNSDGSFDNFLISNQNPDNPLDEDWPSGNHSAPGSWYDPSGLIVDKFSNVYLIDKPVQQDPDLVVHKFDPSGNAVALWDLSGIAYFQVDPDGYIYTSDIGSNLIKKWTPDYQTLVYEETGTLTTEYPVERIRFAAPGDETVENMLTDFMLVVGDTPGATPDSWQVFATPLETLGIIGRTWQDTSTGNLRTDDPTLLSQCDSIMFGAVADGVSSLFMRWKVPGPGTATWSLSDPNLPQEEELLGTISSRDLITFDDVTIEVQSEEVGGEYYAFAVYTAPMDYDRSNVASDPTTGLRLVSITCDFLPGDQGPVVSEVVTIDVRRPPVLIVHGWLSNSGTWSDDFEGFLHDPRLVVHSMDYSGLHGSGLAEVLADGAIVRGVNEAKRLNPSTLATAQVDVIVHSLGGLHTRALAASGNYSRPENMNRGDFHKVLFLDTPHYGSPLADVAVEVREVRDTPFDPVDPVYLVGRRASAKAIINSFAKMFGTTSEQLMNDALDDMRPGSPALASLPEFTVPTHAHVGDASSIWGQNPDIQLGVAQFSVAAGILLGMKVFTELAESWTLLVNQSDLVVDDQSQRGGLASSSYFTRITNYVHSVHTEVTSSPFAADLASTWATRRTTDPTFFAPGLPAPALTMSPIATASIEDSYELLPNYAAERLIITMLDPPGATTTFPGKVIRVRVDGAPADTVGVFYPGGVVIAELEDFQDANGRQITIPIDYAGRFEMIAIGEQGNGGRISTSLPYVLTVDPGAKSPPATVQDMRVEPSTVVLSGPGASTQMSVFAEYSDGVEREIAGAGLGTTFGPSGAYFNITDDGVVVAKLPGSATFTVSNAGHVVPVPVTVLAGQQINNAPHADAGGSYEACDGQVVFLDGSGSYDLDENLGEALTYAWDLDADGQFDDATGSTPAVQLAFPGQYWLLGLKVTDSHGSESTDYAILDAAPGCLDGDFVCTKSRGTDFDWEAYVGTDGDGNIYVAESGSSIANRIVKFSPSCDSIATFPVSEQPSDFVVAADGTSYIPDTFPDGVWKYTNSGVESFLSLPINPGRIAVDGSGNIYCSDNSTTGLVRKYSPAGTAITTWNASQATGTAFPIWEVAVGPNEEIHVASSDRIARAILQGGSYQLDWVTGQAGVDAGAFDQIQGLAVGPSGDLYVSDTENNRIQRFKSDGTFDRMWIGSGKPINGGFEGPQSVAIGAAEQVVVVDRRLSLTWPLRITVFGTETSVVTAELEAFTDDGVNPLTPNAMLPASGCPEGDGDHLVVTVAIDPSEVAGPIPASALALVLPADGDAVSYTSVTADDDATLVNGMYRTTFTMRKFGGCQSSDVLVTLNGIGIGSVPAVLRSPDWEAGGSNGAVNLGDFAWFGGHYTSPPKPYSECADHRTPYGAVNLGDFGHFGAHYTHTSGGGSLLSGTVATADGTLRLELEEESPVVGERRLWARLVLEGVEPFKAMVVALRSGHPDLEYVGWTPSAAYANGTACMELTRDGVKQVFLGVMGTGGVSGGSVELGTVEFAIHGDEALTLSDEDLSFLNAELMSSSDKVLAFSGLRLERTINAPSYEFSLAQNYPNPFNPSTTIAYSLASASDVELTIFDVRGSHVKTVVRERRDAGVHRVPWDGTDNRGNRVASGVYFYRLTAGSFRATKKMVLLR